MIEVLLCNFMTSQEALTLLVVRERLSSKAGGGILEQENCRARRVSNMSLVCRKDRRPRRLRFWFWTQRGVTPSTSV